MMRNARAMKVFLLALLPAAPLHAQDGNIIFPIAEIETRLRTQPFTIYDMRGSRFEDDRTQRVAMEFPDSQRMLVKWAKAPNRGGNTFNNEPRYEIAAYEFQKLFLSEREYVVPPTVMRAVDLDYYRTLQPSAGPTFSNTASVIVVLQYWLTQVSPRDVHNEKRFDTDSLYARHFANLNIFSYLVRHSDSNAGNVLISTDSTNPRVFAVDNGVAFGYESSDRGTAWRNLIVKRVPKSTIERLRKITLDDLHNALGTVGQYEIRDRQLVAVPHTANTNPGAGVRNRDNVVQFGLTDREIKEMHRRITSLVNRVDDGKLQTF
jgi:hypothetical protein